MIFKEKETAYFESLIDNNAESEVIALYFNEHYNTIKLSQIDGLFHKLFDSELVKLYSRNSCDTIYEYLFKSQRWWRDGYLWHNDEIKIVSDFDAYDFRRTRVSNKIYEAIASDSISQYHIVRTIENKPLLISHLYQMYKCGASNILYYILQNTAETKLPKTYLQLLVLAFFKSNNLQILKGIITICEQKSSGIIKGFVDC